MFAVLPGLSLYAEGLDNLDDAVQKAKLKTALTKMECFMCQALERKSFTKTKSRLSSYIAEFANAANGATWSDHVQEHLRKMVAPLLE